MKRNSKTLRTITALAIVAGMTTELKKSVTSVKATETASTTLTIKDGPDIVFGTADNIRAYLDGEPIHVVNP